MPDKKPGKLLTETVTANGTTHTVSLLIEAINQNDIAGVRGRLREGDEVDSWLDESSVGRQIHTSPLSASINVLNHGSDDMDTSREIFRTLLHQPDAKDALLRPLPQLQDKPGTSVNLIDFICQENNVEAARILLEKPYKDLSTDIQKEALRKLSEPPVLKAELASAELRNIQTIAQLGVGDIRPQSANTALTKDPKQLG